MLTRILALVLACPSLVAAPSLAASLSVEGWAHDRKSPLSPTILATTHPADPRSGLSGEDFCVGRDRCVAATWEILANESPLEKAREDALAMGSRLSSLVHPDAMQLAAWKEIYDSPRGAEGDRYDASDREGTDVVLASDVGYDESEPESPPDQDPVPAVPEPSSAIVFGLGALIVVAARSGWTARSKNSLGESAAAESRS